MKINEIICEANYDDSDPFGEEELDRDDIDPFGEELEIDDLESNVDNKVSIAAIKTIRELIGQGHTEVEPSVITNQVVAATGKPFMLKDLIALNNNNSEIRSYVDSINPSKVKFSSDILTVKNESPEKSSAASTKQKNTATVSNMAGRAANRGL